MDAKPERWLVALGLHYCGAEIFWKRDSGLLCMGLRSQGGDARFVGLGEHFESKEEPVITGSMQDWENPDWWRQWEATGVIANFWGLSRFAKVARAIKEAGLFLFAKMDGDGLRTPRVAYWHYTCLSYSTMLDQNRWFPAVQAVLRSSIAWMLPRWHGGGTVEHLRNADLIAIESPIAKQRFCRFLEVAGGSELKGRMRVIVHPMTEDMIYDPGVPKEPLLITVGRWKTHLKGPKRMMGMLARALAERPEYRALVIGSGNEVMEQLRDAMPKEIQARITIIGYMAHEELAAYYQRARIVMNSSVTEGFCLAVGEALCCGASVVGPASIPGFHTCVSYQSGTLAYTRSVANLSDALLAEIDIWEAGERDPVAISTYWKERLHLGKVVQQMLACIDEARGMKAQEGGVKSSLIKG